MGKISSSVTEILVAVRLLIWTHRKFCKEKSGKARSRKPSQPGRPGAYEEALRIFSKIKLAHVIALNNHYH